MASDALYEALAKALSQPSRAYRTAQAAIDVPNQALEGYLKGSDIADKIKQRKLASQTLEEALGGNVPERIRGYGSLPVTTIKNLGGLGDIAKLTETQEPKTENSTDALLAKAVREGKMTLKDAYKLKNEGPLFRSGYAYGPNGTLVPVQGGKPYREISEEEAKKAASRRKQSETAQTVVNSIDTALKQAGVLSTGFVGNLTKNVGGSPAANLDATLNTIRSNVGFETLQEMRQNSPTGGALGQVSDRENNLLQSVRGSLENKQDAKQLATNLASLKEHYQNVILINESQTGDPEADNAIATVIQADIPFEQKRARIRGIRATAGF